MKLCAVIVENRDIKNLDEIIIQHMKMLPPETDLYVYLGMKNLWVEDQLREKLDNFIVFRYLPSPFALAEYNRMFTSPEFWNKFLDYQRVLVFQHDSMILRTGIEEFYEYDYVGAPWFWAKSYCGNGGISLRNPQTMIEVTTRHPWNGILNEDHWLTMHMHDFKIGNPAPCDICEKFSCESLFKLGTWGTHAPDKWLTPEQCHQIRTQYTNS
jgi:hypothetical protein